MREWTLESFRRALICGALVLAAAWVPWPAFQMAALVVLVVFVVFLFRSPAGWPRRLSYMCTSAGIATMLPLASGLQGAANLEIAGTSQRLAWLTQIAVVLEDAPIWPGVLLVMAGVCFAMLQVSIDRKPVDAGESEASIPRAAAVCKSDRSYEATLILAVHNAHRTDIRLTKVDVESVRLIDRWLVRKPRVLESHVLESIDGKSEKVELPREVLPGGWKRLAVTLAFVDRCRRPTWLWAKLLRWILGIDRRYLRLVMGDEPGSRLVEATVMLTM